MFKYIKFAALALLFSVILRIVQIGMIPLLFCH